MARRARAVLCAGEARVGEEATAERDEREVRRRGEVRGEGGRVERVEIKYRRGVRTPDATLGVGVGE
ncbi:MAG: hypothetical protein H0U66_16080 [Gemmatimonadaceae bacterium]|nr:hypothetical protein [Gemmatimonadaceae bacterium]